MRFKLILPLLATALVGCSTTPDEALMEMEEAKMKQRMEQRDETKDTMPDWFEETEEANLGGVTGKGTAFSTDLQSAVDYATLNAESQIAKKTYALISEQVKRNRRSMVVDSSVQEMIVTTTDRYIPEVNISGSRVVKQEIHSERDGFRVYVMMYREADSNFIQQSAEEAMTKAHSELLERNAEYRNQVSKILGR